jgi:hypothetical protein
MPPNDDHLSGVQAAHLRELLSERITALEKGVEAKFAAQQKALELMAVEYERRLTMLNGEAAKLNVMHIEETRKLTAMQATYITRELYEAHLKSADHALADLREWRANLVGRFTMINVGVAAGVSALVAWIVRALN